MGAITGAISRAYHGKRGISPRWLSRLENKGEDRDYIEKSVEKLWRMGRFGGGT